MPFKSPCQPYRLFSSFKQKYISFEIFSPQLLLTKTKTKKQRLPASESDLSSSDTLSSSGDPQVGGGLLERNASALIFFFTFGIREAARRWRASSLWILSILLFMDGRPQVSNRLQPRHYDPSKNSSPNSNDHGDLTASQNC